MCIAWSSDKQLTSQYPIYTEIVPRSRFRQMIRSGAAGFQKKLHSQKKQRGGGGFLFSDTFPFSRL